MIRVLSLLSCISVSHGLTVHPNEDFGMTASEGLGRIIRPEAEEDEEGQLAHKALQRKAEADEGEDEEGGNVNYCRVMNDLPTRCTAGNDYWSTSELRAAIPEFAKFHQSRPITKNKGGGGVNHAFALWFTIKKLKPKYIIESGVYHGGSTWLLRTAGGNETKIFSIDPRPLEVLRWRDDNPNTQYFLGDKFVDFNDIKWDDLIPREDRANTLVFLDDHQSSIRRVKEMLGHQFIHLWYDDNYKFAYPWMGLVYSFSMMCSDVTEATKNKNGKINYHDLFGNQAQEIELGDMKRT